MKENLLVVNQFSLAANEFLLTVNQFSLIANQFLLTVNQFLLVVNQFSLVAKQFLLVANEFSFGDYRSHQTIKTIAIPIKNHSPHCCHRARDRRAERGGE